MSKEIIKINISGMTCVNCSNGIEKAVNKLDGLLSSKVSFASNEGEFEIENKLLDKESLFNKIRKLGYGVGLLKIPCQSDKIISRIDNGRENKL
jgi:Cu+-exporting ATPase